MNYIRGRISSVSFTSRKCPSMIFNIGLCLVQVTGNQCLVGWKTAVGIAIPGSYCIRLKSEDCSVCPT